MKVTELCASNVSAVAQAYLCCSCGACEAVCPDEAISMVETPGGYCFPSIDQDRCTRCGECLACCAGIRLHADLPEDPFEGDILSCRVGRAVDDSVYQRSQSGGAVTALLLALMQEERISGAVTVVMAAGTPPRPAGLIGRNRDDLLAAQGSKYCPVPILSTLKGLEGEGKPVALVCLGCHVHGLRNILERNPDLGKKVGPVIGLICDRVMASSAIDYLVWRSGINHREKSTLEYRSKKWRGYPGDVRVVGETDKESFLPDKERKRIKDFFTPARCRLCFDKMNVLSDVTVGDPWGIEDFDKARGESVIIARTQSGLQTVKAAARAGYLDLREIPYEDVLRGQGIDRKRKEFAAYCREWASMDRPLPEQSESVLGSLRLQRPDKVLSAHFHRAFTLDHYSKKVNMFRDVRKWLRKRRLLKKIEKIFRPLYSVALFLRRKQP